MNRAAQGTLCGVPLQKLLDSERGLEYFGENAVERGEEALKPYRNVEELWEGEG